MGPKIRALSVIGIIFISILYSICYLQETSADENNDNGPEMKNVGLFLHGDLGNASLNTSYGTEREDIHILTTGATDLPTPNSIYIGEWMTKPIEYSMIISGNVRFMIYAIGDLQQVRFTSYLTVNGVGVSPQMTTQRQDLNETFPVEFSSEYVNLTSPLELNVTDTIGISLSLDHSDFQYYIPPPRGPQGKNVTLVFGYGFGSFVHIYTNSMQVTQIKGTDSPPNMLVTATIKCSLGYEDLSSVTATSKYGTLYYLTDRIIDNATVEVDWNWAYTVQEGGSYEVTVTAKDRNYNSWKKSEDLHIATPDTEIDFFLSDSSISFSSDPKLDKNTTITAKVSGSGKTWSNYQVDVEFYDDSELIEKVKASISRGGTKDVSVLWVPEKTGAHQIKVIVDPDDDFQETNENNNEATKNVDVKEGSGGGGIPGFEGMFLIIAFAAVMIFMIWNRRI